MILLRNSACFILTLATLWNSSLSIPQRNAESPPKPPPYTGGDIFLVLYSIYFEMIDATVKCSFNCMMITLFTYFKIIEINLLISNKASLAKTATATSIISK
uniref:Secreted protein n=1 Tax=Romanomermis culicivorax TaxID=13658 RepID=A0A915I7K4_ROMCU